MAPVSEIRAAERRAATPHTPAPKSCEAPQPPRYETYKTGFRRFCSVPDGTLAEISAAEPAAMDAGEIDTFTARVARFTGKGLRAIAVCMPFFTARVARFTGKGLGLEDAERLADALTRRDRDGDERRLCIECAHLHGRGPWHCVNWQRAGLSTGEVSRDLALMPQRCDGFAGAVQ